ncbi:MAG: hypothetical protein ACI8P0_001638 [Planctomycetaceae bacterium]
MIKADSGCTQIADFMWSPHLPRRSREASNQTEQRQNF